MRKRDRDRVEKQKNLPRIGIPQPYVHAVEKKPKRLRAMDFIDGLDEPMISPEKIPEGMFQAWDKNSRRYKIVSEPSQEFWKKRY